MSNNILDEIGEVSHASTPPNDGLALTIGTFDGVHLGHQMLLEAARDIARDRGIESAAYTYELPPKKYLNDPGPSLIMDPRAKLDYLKDYVDRVVVGDFQRVKDFTPQRYVEQVLVEELNVKAVVVGKDWRFGRDRTGSHRELQELSRGRFTVHTKSQLEKEGRSISSTWVRQALREGNIELVRELLGRYPGYCGKVVRGDQVGSDLGFPTANIRIDRRVGLPKRGNYAALADLEGRELKGAVHIGNRPTFSGNSRSRLEIHLLNFDGELYGESLTVRLVSYLGPSERYGGKRELREGIRERVERAKEVLSEMGAAG